MTRKEPKFRRRVPEKPFQHDMFSLHFRRVADVQIRNVDVSEVSQAAIR